MRLDWKIVSGSWAHVEMPIFANLDCEPMWMVHRCDSLLRGVCFGWQYCTLTRAHIIMSLQGPDEPCGSHSDPHTMGHSGNPPTIFELRERSHAWHDHIMSSVSLSGMIPPKPEKVANQQGVLTFVTVLNIKRRPSFARAQLRVRAD